jgi:hypothetical protein
MATVAASLVACRHAPAAPASPATHLDALVAAALADASQRSALPASALRVVKAEAVTWRDGAGGCPAPGMLYTQGLVPGYRIRILAGDRLLDYHAGRSGPAQWCPPERVQEPIQGDAFR